MEEETEQEHNWTREEEIEQERWEKEILEEDKICREKKEETKRQCEILTEETKRILRIKFPEANEAQILKWVNLHPRKDLQGPKPDIAKYYQAFFGNRDLLTKCDDGVYRQFGRW